MLKIDQYPTTKSGRVLNARPDTLDFRDLMYVPTLVEVPTHIPLDEYRAQQVPILDQGQEGACTGFGLATAVNYLLRKRKVVSDGTAVSAKMLYELARRYDEWPGESYEGSSARGAMKGWHKHGVCADSCWARDQRLSPAVVKDAISRPLGAYFRVNHKDLVAMHCALAEVGVLYATGSVHKGWEQVDTRTGRIPLESDMLGGHAFAIVAFDSEGFWIQNSWGTGWGMGGFARISYDDWLANGTDAWAARLGVPAHVATAEGVANRASAVAGLSDAASNYELQPHIISLGNDGQLRTGGAFGNTLEALLSNLGGESGGEGRFHWGFSA